VQGLTDDVASELILLGSAVRIEISEDWMPQRSISLSAIGMV
jgi:hypothetical protein